MPKRNPQPTNPEWLPRPKKPEFSGFAEPRSNTTYIPNQFFDVCLPFYSRGVVRLTAYMLRKTLGWSDAEGNPLKERYEISYEELIEQAGISRGALREAIDDAMKGNFLRCAEKGHASRAGTRALSSTFELKWHEGEYTKDSKQFKGFYAGEGNRTYIPNQFFDVVIPNEPLTVIKVVGSIIRFSMGFQTRHGFRRQQIALSYRDIERYSKIGSPIDTRKAIKTALESNYIERVEEGYFDPNAGRESKAATYCLRWAKVRQESISYEETGSKNIAGNRFKKHSGIGSKNIAGNRFKKHSDIQITYINKTFKQQQAAVPKIEREDKASYARLLEAGFDPETAAKLASVRSLEHIEQQITWLPLRHPSINPLGLLRRAIEENWPEPVNLQAEATAEESPVMIFAKHFYAGYGHNVLQPVARPSITDIRDAGVLVEALLKIWPDPSRIAQWGRCFGETIAQKTASRNFAMTLSAAIRSYGDAFAANTKRAKEERMSKVAIENRAAYREANFPAYLQYATSQEAKIKGAYPEEYQVFLNTREENRQWLEKMPNGFLKTKMIEAFDREESRLKDFANFFHDLVGDFWEWDKKYSGSHSITM